MPQFLARFFEISDESLKHDLEGRAWNVESSKTKIEKLSCYSLRSTFYSLNSRFFKSPAGLYVL